MSAPKSDKAGIRQCVTALASAGWMPWVVYDGEDEIRVTTNEAAVKAVTDVDEAHLLVRHAEHGRGRVLFVLGNDPEEVIADYTTNLSAVIDPLTAGWED